MQAGALVQIVCGIATLRHCNSKAASGLVRLHLTWLVVTRESLAFGAFGWSRCILFFAGRLKATVCPDPRRCMALTKVFIENAEPMGKRNCEQRWQKVSTSLCSEREDVKRRVVRYSVERFGQRRGKEVIRNFGLQGRAEELVFRMVRSVVESTESAATNSVSKVFEAWVLKDVDGMLLGGHISWVFARFIVPNTEDRV